MWVAMAQSRLGRGVKLRAVPSDTAVATVGAPVAAVAVAAAIGAVEAVA